MGKDAYPGKGEENTGKSGRFQRKKEREFREKAEDSSGKKEREFREKEQTHGGVNRVPVLFQ